MICFPNGIFFFISFNPCNTISPVNQPMHQETRIAFTANLVSYFSIMKIINQAVPPPSRILHSKAELEPPSILRPTEQLVYRVLLYNLKVVYKGIESVLTNIE